MTSKPALTLSFVTLLFVAISFIVTQVVSGNEPRPNIVVILCDDLGYSDVGFNGAKDIQTPALDQLAHAGAIFTSAYVTHPFCGPSRMGLMAGRYPSDDHLTFRRWGLASKNTIAWVFQKAKR